MGTKVVRHELQTKPLGKGGLARRGGSRHEYDAYAPLVSFGYLSGYGGDLFLLSCFGDLYDLGEVTRGDRFV